MFIFMFGVLLFYAMLINSNLRIITENQKKIFEEIDKLKGLIK